MRWENIDLRIKIIFLNKNRSFNHILATPYYLKMTKRKYFFFTVKPPGVDFFRAPWFLIQRVSINIIICLYQPTKFSRESTVWPLGPGLYYILRFSNKKKLTQWLNYWRFFGIAFWFVGRIVPARKSAPRGDERGTDASLGEEARAAGGQGG